MDKMRYLLPWFPLYVFLSLVFVWPIGSSAAGLKEYYPLNEGDIWKYKTHINSQVSSEEAKVMREESVRGVKTFKVQFSEGENNEPGEALNLTAEDDGIKMYRSQIRDAFSDFDPPVILFPEIENGQKIEYSADITSYKIKEMVPKETKSFSYSSVFLGKEDVEVPAGKFSDCLKFSYNVKEFEKGKKDRDDYDCTSWFALGVGKVKEFCVNTEYRTEEDKEAISGELYELTSAYVDGKQIGSQQAPAK